MELKAVLKRPYTDREKIDFILAYHATNRHEIRYTEVGIEAWDYTEEEKKYNAKIKLKQEIMQQLDSLDLKSIRAIRANDTEYIERYEAEAQELREKLRELD